MPDTESGRSERPDDEYLPGVYRSFVDSYPDVAAAQGELARVVRAHSPLDGRAEHLVKFALSVGAQADGAVRSNVRKALQHGVAVEELRWVALAAITTCGFPTAVAALGWIEEVLQAERGGA